MKELLTNEVTSELEVLSSMDVGSESYKTSVEGIAKLVDKVIELEKLESQKKKDELDVIKAELDKTERENRKYLDNKQLELQQLQNNQNARNSRLGLAVTVGTALLTAGITIWGTIVTLDFEREDTVTTSAGKSFLGRLFAKK